MTPVTNFHYSRIIRPAGYDLAMIARDDLITYVGNVQGRLERSAVPDVPSNQLVARISEERQQGINPEGQIVKATNGIASLK